MNKSGHRGEGLCRVDYLKNVTLLPVTLLPCYL